MEKSVVTEVNLASEAYAAFDATTVKFANEMNAPSVVTEEQLAKEMNTMFIVGDDSSWADVSDLGDGLELAGYEMRVVDSVYYLRHVLDDGVRAYYCSVGEDKLTLGAILQRALLQNGSTQSDAQARATVTYQNRLLQATEELVEFFGQVSGRPDKAVVAYNEDHVGVVLPQECCEDVELPVRTLNELAAVAERLDYMIGDLTFYTSCVVKVSKFCQDAREEELYLFEHGALPCYA